MIDELGREELLDRFKGWIVDCKASYIAYEYEWTEKDNQAYEQIVALIQKPGVTEEFIEEKAIELNNEILLESYGGNYHKVAAAFIRSLVEEI